MVWTPARRSRTARTPQGRSGNPLIVRVGIVGFMADPYWWVRQSPVVMVTAIRGRSIRDCLAAWGPVLEEPEWLPYYEAVSLASRSYGDGGPTWTIADELSGAVLMWDPYGDGGLDTSILCALTADNARALTVASYPKVRGRFLYAENGVLVAEASSLTGAGVTGADPVRVAAAMAEAGVDPQHPTVEACLQLAPVLLGVEILPPGEDRQVLAAPHASTRRA